MTSLIERVKGMFHPRIRPERPAPFSPSRLVQKGIRYELVRIKDNQASATPIKNPEDAIVEIEANCPSCGGEYPSPLGRECVYCGSSRRQVFLRKLGDGSFSPGAPQDLSAPEGLNFTEDGYVLGSNATVTRLISEKIAVGNDFACTVILIGKEIATGLAADIACIVILDHGKASFDHGTHIGTLVAGYGVELIFGNDCQVDRFFVLKLDSIETGPNFKIGHREQWGRHDFETYLKDHGYEKHGDQN